MKAKEQLKINYTDYHQLNITENVSSAALRDLLSIPKWGRCSHEVQQVARCLNANFVC